MRNKRHAVAVGVTGLLVLLGTSMLWAFQHWSRLSRADLVLNKIDSLVLEAPRGCSELEWSILVYWTHNLHCEASPVLRTRESALANVENILHVAEENGASRTVIDELWAEYSQLPGIGRDFCKKYESVRDSIIEDAQTDNFGDERSYRDFKQSVLSSDQRGRGQ